MRRLAKREHCPHTPVCRRMSTPEESVDAFLYAVRYNRNQRQLMEVPSSIPETFVPQPQEVKAVVATRARSGSHAVERA